MGWSSQPGLTAFRTQTARGVPAADIATKGVAVRLTGGALAGKRELQKMDAEMGGGRDLTNALLGTISFAGEYEYYVRFRFIATFLKAVLGNVATTGTEATGFTHTFTPSDSSGLPFLSVYERISSGLETMKYHDVAVNTFHLEADPGSYLTGTAGMIGARQTMGVPPVDVSGLFDDTTSTVGTNITVRYDNVDIEPTNFSIDIANNMTDDDFRLGSFYLKDITPKRRDVSVTLGLVPVTSAMMRQSLLGSSVLTEAGGITTKLPLEIEILTYEDIPGTVPPVRYSLTITIPCVIFEPYAFEPKGDEEIKNDVTCTAVRPDQSVPILTAVLVTDAEVIAYDQPGFHNPD